MAHSATPLRSDMPGQTPEAPTPLHLARLDTVAAVLADHDVRRFADLGCGRGALLDRLAGSTKVDHVVAVDLDGSTLAALQSRLAEVPGLSLEIVEGSLLDGRLRLGPIDAAVLLEAIEHIPPEDLSKLEMAVFRAWRPRLVVMTTPNADANGYLGVPSGRRRHWDHRFEWGRERFERWAQGVARRSGYRVGFQPIGWVHPSFGAPTQMAVFLNP